VDIAGRSRPDRINAAYAYGGVGLLINTLNETLQLDIQRFVMFDFWSCRD
jgi:anionic cell wall polymer biosynthesis LytR-Cps2A-Psr (LCP) family protein